MMALPRVDSTIRIKLSDAHLVPIGADYYSLSLRGEVRSAVASIALLSRPWTNVRMLTRGA